MEAIPCQDSTQRSASAPPARNLKPRNFFTGLQPLGLGYPTFIYIVILYRSMNEPWTIAFLVAAYVDFTLLMWCVRALERTPKASPKTGGLKMAVWSLSTVLILMFSYRVTSIALPSLTVVVVWGISGLSIAANFYGLFVYGGDSSAVSKTETTRRG